MITFRNLGRLGRFANGCFQIAGTIGIAKRYGYDFAFPEWKNHDQLNFDPSHDIDVQKYFVNPLPVAEDLERFPEVWVHWGYHPGHYPDNISLNGHLQSDKYFSHCIDLIRHYFRMKDEPEQNDYVAIHYRAGDYTEGADSYHPRQPREYYENALKHFPEETKFIIFTDADMNEVIRIMPDIVLLNAKVAHGTYLEDFRLMKRCKSFITANSSYSIFAAILGEHPDKKIICPKLFFGTAAGGLNADDVYPQNSIII